MSSISREERGFDFAAIYAEARERFLSDATSLDLYEHLARVAYERGSLSPELIEALTEASAYLDRYRLSTAAMRDKLRAALSTTKAERT